MRVVGGDPADRNGKFMDHMLVQRSMDSSKKSLSGYAARQVYDEYMAGFPLGKGCFSVPEIYSLVLGQV